MLSRDKSKRREMAVWCASLLGALALCALLSAGLGWGRMQLDTGRVLAGDTLRLHIRADSDSLLDQSAKLAVRDVLLALTDTACPRQDKTAALSWAARNLPHFELTAQQTLSALGIHTPVKASLVNMYFDTRQYADAALPAGRYDALRIDIGADRTGQNWWCVLYPGLCRSACGGYALPEENDLVCGEYLIRFRLVEWWNERTAPRGDILLAG